jgi:hypothetical protein
MKILFDLSAVQPIHNNDFHGGSEYAKTVFYKLCKRLPENTQLDVFYNPDKNIDNDILEQCKKKGLAEFFCKNNIGLIRLLKKNKYDIFYTALPYSYIDIHIPLETKFIYTVHGLRSLECPWDKYILKYTKNNLKMLIKHTISKVFPGFWENHLKMQGKRNFSALFSLAKKQCIITVSFHSKYAISFFFPNIDLPSIKVLYSPAKSVNNDIKNEEEILTGFGLKSKKYILLIGGDRFEKGAYRACGALCKVFSKNINDLNDMKIIVLGVSNKKPYLQITDESPQFIFSGYVSASVLETLYKNAHLFVYPTLNEGFGYPPLEAMKYGTLCACSANSAVTEVCADSVLYFNPYDDTEMGIRILQSFDEDIRREKIEKMRVRSALIRQKQEQDLDALVDLITSPPVA